MNVLCLGSWLVNLLYINVPVQRQDGSLAFGMGTLCVAISNLVVCVSLRASQYSYTHMCVDFMEHLVALETETPLRLKCRFGQPSRPAPSIQNHTNSPQSH